MSRVYRNNLKYSVSRVACS